MSNKYRSPTRVPVEALEFDKSVIQRQFPGITNIHNYRVLMAALRRTIAEDLTEQQRTQLVLYMNGNTMRVIADKLGISASSVSRTIARAKRRVQKAMRFYVEYSRVDFREED